MEDFTFTGLGTKWFVRVDGKQLDNRTQKAVVEYVQDFENRFSRFLPLSAIGALFGDSVPIWFHLVLMIWIAIPSGIIVAKMTNELLGRIP